MSRADCRKSSTEGQTLIEFALVLPLLLLLIVNVVNFGAFFFAWITVANAARSGAQYMCLGGASLWFLKKAANSAQIYNLVSADISSLPDRRALAVRSCTQNFRVAPARTTTGTGTFTNPS